MLEADVAVLGAGPAGSVAARELAQSGLSVALIDPGKAPVGHKLESFPPSGRPLAEEIGVASHFSSACLGTVARTHLAWRRNPETRDYHDRSPMLIDRAVLRRNLLRAALETSGSLQHFEARAVRLRFLPDCAVVETKLGPVRAKLVIDARGRAGGGGNRRSTGDVIALAFSGLAPVTGETEMLLESFPDAWLWASRLADGRVHGALFQRSANLAGLNADERELYGRQLLRASSVLQTIDDLQFARPSPAGFAALDDPVPTERHIVIGDAALARDPIASHGIAHALRTAVQGAAAARTILFRNHDCSSAICFLRLKHLQASRGAKSATQRAYSEQSRFKTQFWDYPAVSNSSTEPEYPIGRVLLAQPLRRAPLLEDGLIRWAPAVALPLTGDFAVSLGPITAEEIAAACQPPATLPEVAARLGRRHRPVVVAHAIGHLVAGGAFGQASAHC